MVDICKQSESVFSTPQLFCVFVVFVLHFHVFSLPGRSLGALVGPSDVLGIAWWALGASLWALVTS